MSVQPDRIPDSLGYLVLTEDGAVVNEVLDKMTLVDSSVVMELAHASLASPRPALFSSPEHKVLKSGGDLENAEDMASEFMKLVQTACAVPLSNSKKDKFRKITVTWDSICYVITISNHKIYICKRKYLPHEPAVA